MASRYRCVDLLPNGCFVVAHNRPDVGAQYYQSNFPALESLLVDDILISGYYDLEAGFFCGLEKFTIADAFPAAVIDRFNFVIA